MLCPLKSIETLSQLASINYPSSRRHVRIINANNYSLPMKREGESVNTFISQQGQSLGSAGSRP